MTSRILLLILGGFVFCLMMFLMLFYNTNRVDGEIDQDDVIPQHYDLEFIDRSDHMVCHVMIFFQFQQSRYHFSIVKSSDHVVQRSSIILYRNQRAISVRIDIERERILIKKQHWNRVFQPGNYSISITNRVNISNTIKGSFIRQSWSSKYRILFSNNHILPFLPHSFSRSSFNINIISTDAIVSNVPLKQTSSFVDISQIAFALLHQYDCRTHRFFQLCLPNNHPDDLDFFSHLFDYAFQTISIIESYFSRRLPTDQLTFVSVLELNTQMISKSGLVFIDQNALLTNTSVEQILLQRELLFLILASQWIDTLIPFGRDQKWIGKALARNLAHYLFNRIYDPNGNNHSHTERFMSTIIIDSLCNTEWFKEVDTIPSERLAIDKGDAFLTEYRLTIGDNQFQTRMQDIIHHFDNQSSSYFTWSEMVDHLNSSTFKINSNCSTSNHVQLSNNTSSVLPRLNPFIRPNYSSWQRTIDEMKALRPLQLHSLAKLLFDSFLLNLANQLSIEYPLQILNIFFEQSVSIFTRNDLFLVKKILYWYRSMLSNTLEERFLLFLRQSLNPFCSNQLWTRQISIDMKYYNQQIINDILLELCCSINHSVCFQQISTRNDPQILLQMIFNNQPFDISLQLTSMIDQTQLTSFNQLQMPSLFLYPDRIVENLVCQTVRQQNDKYWSDLIHFLQRRFSSQSMIPAAILTGLSCAIRTTKQVDFYLNDLCPPTPFKWRCYRNLLIYSTMKNFAQLPAIADEQWPVNHDALVDFLFHTGTIEMNVSSSHIIPEFQSFILTWLTTNERELRQWLDHENNQNAYLI